LVEGRNPATYQARTVYSCTELTEFLVQHFVGCDSHDSLGVTSPMSATSVFPLSKTFDASSRYAARTILLTIMPFRRACWWQLLVSGPRLPPSRRRISRRSSRASGSPAPIRSQTREAPSSQRQGQMRVSDTFVEEAVYLLRGLSAHGAAWSGGPRLGGHLRACAGYPRSEI
jgi:hypothetical protein